MIQKSDDEILAQRARALASARPDSAFSFDTAHDHYLVVVCGADRFAVALESVAEVFRPLGVTPVPRAIPPLWGLTSWRGSILSVIVIGECLPAQGSGVIITLASGPRVIAGLWVDEVEGEIAIGKEEIHPPSVTTGMRDSLVSGVTSDAKSVFDAESLARLLDERTKQNDRDAVQNSTGTKV